MPYLFFVMFLINLYSQETIWHVRSLYCIVVPSTSIHPTIIFHFTNVGAQWQQHKHTFFSSFWASMRYSQAQAQNIISPTGSGSFLGSLSSCFLITELFWLAPFNTPVSPAYRGGGLCFLVIPGGVLSGSVASGRVSDKENSFDFG